MNSACAFIDIGGSSIKVSLMEIESHKTYSHSISIQPIFSAGHIFLEPEKLLGQIIEAMNQAVNSANTALRLIKVSISSLRQGFCLVSGSKEISPIYLNSDTSGQFAQEDEEEYGMKKMYSETGHWFAPQLTLPKMINLKRTSPQKFDGSTRVLFVHDWLVWRLTGVQITEMGLVSAGQLAAIDKNQVNFEVLEFFGFSENILPEVVEFNHQIGNLRSDVRKLLSASWWEVEVHVGGGDSHFLHLGATMNESNVLVVSAGSSTPISWLNESKIVTSELHPWISTSFKKGHFFLEGNLGYPGTHYSWLTKNFGRRPQELLINIEGISKAPQVFGACNLWNEEKWESRPPFTIVGNIGAYSNEELILGLLLDYAFSLANQVQNIQKDFAIASIVITGGGSNADLCKLLRSLIDVPVFFLPQEDAVTNLLCWLNDYEVSARAFRSEINPLDFEISQYLKNLAGGHSQLYSELEGTRGILNEIR
jgi:sugar (pentulose or hexulose) kinase